MISFQVAGAVFLGTVIYTRGIRELREDFADRTNSLVTGVSIAATQVFCEGDAAKQEKFLKDVAEAGGLTFLAVHRGVTEVARYGPRDEHPMEFELAKRLKHQIEAHGIYAAFAEIPSCRADQPPLELEAGISFHALDHSLSSLLRSVVLSVGLQILAGLGAAWLLGRLVTRRLAGIQRLLDRISKGEALGPHSQNGKGSNEFALIEQSLFVAGEQLESLTRERERQRQNLVSTSKLSSLGEMAGGIAHEINNPLAILSARLEQVTRLLGKETLDRTKCLENLKKCEETVGRIAHIVKGLRLFSRNAENDPKILTSLKAIVEDSLSLCLEKFRLGNFEVELSLEPDSLICCRPTQISQVLINLLNNSYDACKDLEKRWVRIEQSVEDDLNWVKLIVTDSGGGIPESVRDKIMNPFFTTKEVGKGTGLGLSVSQGIVREHGGELEIDASCPNTRFVVRLPREA